MSGKLLSAVIVMTALLAGAALYYLQVYAYYSPVAADAPGAEVRLTSLATGRAEPVPVDGFEGIDSDSSPLRFRACFELPYSIATLTETYEMHKAPVPLTAPRWFGCFDAAEIGAALDQGRALAFLGEANVSYGIDRVIAVFEDGRAFAWNQINACGETVFDGKPAPQGCPPVPEAK